jgi:hypothetical protein
MMLAQLEVVKLGILGHFFLDHGKRLILLSAVAASGIAFVVMRAWLPSALDKLIRFVQTKKVRGSLCAVFLAIYLITLVGSTTYVGYLGHIEPNIASVSFILLKGAPLYHAVESTQRYSLLYGPMSYLPYALALHVLGANVLSLKLVVFFANLLLLWLLWRCYRQLLNRPDTLLVLAVVIAFLLISETYTFQVRGDILIVLSVALGLFAVLSTSKWVSVLLFALACAFSFDIKFTALIYFFPLYILVIRRHGWRSAALIVISAVVLALIPFLLPQVSAAGYLKWLHLASRHPITQVEVVHELKVLPFVFVPFVLLFWELARRSRNTLATYLLENRVFLVALGASLAAVAVSASTIGAGPHHFMPLYPIAGYVCAHIYREIQSSKVTPSPPPRLNFSLVLWLWFAVALAAQIRPGMSATLSTVLKSSSRSMAADVTSDLRGAMRDHPGKTIEMGYGDWNAKYGLTFFRSTLVFAGNPYTIDAVALADLQLSGVDIPPSTLDYLQQCKTQIWLIPKGDPPFDLVNVFSLIDPRVFPDRRMFSDEFRRIFFLRYRKQSSSKYFDIWECETESGLRGSLKADSVAKPKDTPMSDRPLGQSRMRDGLLTTRVNMRNHAL